MVLHHFTMPFSQGRSGVFDIKNGTVKMNMNLQEAKSHIVELFAQCDAFPKGANITLRNDTPELTIVLHCDWMLAHPKLNSKKTSRLITLQLTSSATQMFLDADKVALQTLDNSLQYIVRSCLKKDYRETDPQVEPFIIRIDKTNLD